MVIVEEANLNFKTEINLLKQDLSDKSVLVNEFEGVIDLKSKDLDELQAQNLKILEESSLLVEQLKNLQKVLISSYLNILTALLYLDYKI